MNSSTSAFIGAAVATFVVGALVALQPPVNSELGRHTSSLAAALISGGVTFLALGVIFLAFGDFSSLKGVREAPAGLLTGGLFGAAFVAVSLITVRTLGAGATFALVVCAQLIVATILDRIGFLGLDEIAITPLRVIGLVALIAGTLAIVVDKGS